MIALAVQIRILFLLLLAALGAYIVWRLWQRARVDPRLRPMLTGVGLRLLLLYLLRRGLPLLLRALRGLRFFR